MLHRQQKMKTFIILLLLIFVATLAALAENITIEQAPTIAGPWAVIRNDTVDVPHYARLVFDPPRPGGLLKLQTSADGVSWITTRVQIPVAMETTEAGFFRVIVKP